MSETGVEDEHPNTRNTSLKRPRPVISCLECRRKKLKCDRNLPCQQCIKAKRQGACIFQPGQEPELHFVGGGDRENSRPGSAVRSDRPQQALQPLPRGKSDDPLSTPSLSAFNRLAQRVAALESIVGVASNPSSLHEHRNWRPHQGPQLSLSHDSATGSRPRQSMPSEIFPTASSFLNSWLDPEQDLGGKAAEVLNDLQMLYQSLKDSQKPRIPTYSPFPQNDSSILRLIPSQPVCRLLIEMYFDNLEHCFRILHKPTFERQLNRFFESGETISQRDFVPQLIAVLAISSILGIRQECIDVGNAFDSELIRTSAAYIESHLASLTSKDRYTVTTLQTRMLLLLLRWMRLDKLKELWELSGQILRQALAMGLAFDPRESLNGSFSLLDGEIRRRLWMTICEQDMMLSILCNMPCSIPNFSCQAPLNVNDDELEQDLAPASRELSEWSDCLCQCYLTLSLAQRLHGCREIQYASRDSYSSILEHTRNMEQCLQDLPAALRFDHVGDVASKAPARLMARMELDITIRRPLMQLYSPFFYDNDSADVYAEARQGYLKSCMMLTSYQDLFDPRYSEISVQRPQGYWDFFWNVYRNENTQSLLGHCLEIQRLSSSSHPNEVVANHSFAAFKMPAYTKSTLIHSVEDTLEPMIRRISHMGSNLKDVAYFQVVFSSVQAAQSTANGIIEALEDLAAKCKIQMERDGIPLVTFSTSGEVWEPNFDLETAWMTFPPLTTRPGDVNEMDFRLEST